MEKYESEHTQFIRDWLKQHPEEIAEQKAGRALWWDKPPQTPAVRKDSLAATVPPKAYYYDVN
jgi:hypothetical protein